jgi:hypothetical protein
VNSDLTFGLVVVCIVLAAESLVGLVINLRLRQQYGHRLPSDWRQVSSLTISGFACQFVGAVVMIAVALSR